MQTMQLLDKITYQGVLLLIMPRMLESVIQTSLRMKDGELDVYRVLILEHLFCIYRTANSREIKRLQ